jgi:hypothetical protein
MRLRLRLLVALVLPLLVAGCSDLFSPEDCTTDIRHAIEVEVRSATTGAWLANEATGVVIDGAYRDSLRHSRGSMVDGAMVWEALSAAEERPGTYRVEVSAPGHVPWVRENVRVRDGACHVNTVVLDARLQPVQR